MTFGDLRSMIHRGELPPLFATLPEEQQRYAERLVGEGLAARTERLRLAEGLVYAEDPLNYKVCRAASQESEGRLDGVLRWYACDVAEEAMRLYGDGDPRSLRAIEVSRKYVLGEVGEEELKRARQAARAVSYAAATDVRSAATDAAATAAATAASSYFAASAAAAARAAYAAYAAAAYDAYYDEALANLEGWFRCYLMRWIEEGAWWA